MEDEIQEMLEKIYKFPIEVYYEDLREYQICGMISEFYTFDVTVIYDGHLTKEMNIQSFCHEIDKAIIEELKF